MFDFEVGEIYISKKVVGGKYIVTGVTDDSVWFNYFVNGQYIDWAVWYERDFENDRFDDEWAYAGKGTI